MDGKVRGARAAVEALVAAARFSGWYGWMMQQLAKDRSQWSAVTRAPQPSLTQPPEKNRPELAEVP